VIHDPTRNAIASINPKVLIVKPKIVKSSGYIERPRLRDVPRPSKAEVARSGAAEVPLARVIDGGER
jgi:hypothetical protein